MVSRSIVEGGEERGREEIRETKNEDTVSFVQSDAKSYVT